MKLDKGQVVYASTRSIGHGQTISGGDIGVGRLFPKTSNAPRGEHDGVGLDIHDVLRFLVQTPHSSNSHLRVSVLALNQINGERIGPERDVWVLACERGQGPLNLFSRSVFCMQYSLTGVAPLSDERIGAIGCFLKFNPDLNQIPNPVTSFADDRPNHRFITPTISRTKRVLDVRFHALLVCFIQNGSDAALGPVGRGIFGALFGDNRDVVTCFSQF